MADIQIRDRIILEKFLQMESGYVLDFSDRTLRDYVGEITGYDIADPKYGEGSKAKRMREFWRIEDNETISNLIKDLVRLRKHRGELEAYKLSEMELKLAEQSLAIADRLNPPLTATLINVSALKSEDDDPDLIILYNQIEGAIEKGHEQAALDRLHTWLIKYIRGLLDKHNISYTETETLNAIVGKYRNHLHAKGYIQSGMTSEILKGMVKYFEEFNLVRNRQSLAHDTPLLNKSEARCIVTHVITSIEFIQSVEEKIDFDSKKVVA